MIWRSGMALIDGLLTVREAVEYLRLNGIEMGEVYLRILLGTGKITSRKLFGKERMIERNVLARYVENKKKEIH